MSKQTTKQRLLDTGISYIIAHGYHNSGLNNILTAAQIPKGSFYYYFQSKEDFGLQALDRFAASTLALLRRFLDDESILPLGRLRCYFEFNVEYLAQIGFRHGCLIGNLGQEMADLSEPMRQHIDQRMSEWATALGLGFQQAQQQGQLDPALEPFELGAFCLNSWQGALLRMKSTKDAKPLRAFIHLFFDLTLGQPRSPPN